MTTQLELFSKAAAAIGLVSYVVGLVTVNAWLFRLGVSEFSAINPRFVYTGAVMLALITLTILCYLGALRAVTSKKWPLLLFAAVPPVLIGVLLGIQGPPYQPIEAVIRQSLFISVSLGALLAVSAAAWSYFTGREEPARGRVSRIVAQAMKPVPTVAGRAMVLTLLLPAAFGVVTAMLGGYVYPEVPEQFGGGQARKAKLAINSDAAAELGQLGVEINETTHISEPVYVLFETQEAYVIRIGGEEGSPDYGRVVLIDKDEVEGVAFDRFL